MRIDSATPADADEIAAIYAHHVIHGTASWELEPPSTAEMTARIAKTLDHGWPWLVARAADENGGGENGGGENGDGAILGYAYAGQLNPRPGYLHACENSIYIGREHLGKGIGTALLAALLDACEKAGFRQMVALIAGTAPASIALHARAGFTHCGLLKSVGRKHGQWLDCVYMQRALGEGDASSPENEAGPEGE